MASCLTMAAMSFSCITFDQDFSPAEDKVHDYPVKVNAVQETMTRISADGNALSWDEEDQIQIAAVMPGIEVSDTAATSVLTRFRSIDSDPAKASFTGFVSLLSEPDTCYFTYPVGEALKVDPVAETIITNYTSQDGSHKPFLYGKSEYDKEGMDVVMKHVGAVLELTVTTPGVTKVSFIGNKIEYLSPIVINTETESIGLPTDAVRQITVDVQQSGKTYLFVPPLKFEKGFTLVCSNDDGKRYFMKSYTDGASAGYDFSSKRGARIPIAIEGEFKEFAVTASDFNIEHKKNASGLLTGTKVTFKMSKAGTSNKLIEGWGATLADKSGNVVRTYSSTGAITGNVYEMNIPEGDNHIFLDAGEYTLTPYYIMHGNRVTFDGASLPKKEIGDPGIVLTIGGATSYDKYIDGNSSTDPNTHTNTLLEGLTVSTNVAEEVIKEYSASLVGNDGKAVTIGTPSPAVKNSNNVRTYGDKTCSTFQAYTMAVSFKVGHIAKTVSRVFHITGLPYEADFSKKHPEEMTPSWDMIGTSYKDNRVVYNTNGASGLRSPVFHVPDNGLVVNTACDCMHNYTTGLFKKTAKDMYISPCPSSQGSAPTSGTVLSITTDYYDDVTSASSFKSKNKYLSCSSAFTLSKDKPCLVYTFNITNSYITGNIVVSFKHKIEYSK